MPSSNALPPCYDEQTDERYPVLYLLHGQTYNYDQWIRLGAVQILDQIILSGESQPFIVVFPDDRYWNLVAGPGFGKRLIESVIPHVDSTYRTIPDRDHRAIGGMSRGAGWSLQLGLTHWQLFSAVGLHSLAVLQKDYSKIRGWVRAIPQNSRPQVFMDIGDADQELSEGEQHRRHVPLDQPGRGDDAGAEQRADHPGVVEPREPNEADAAEAGLSRSKLQRALPAANWFCSRTRQRLLRAMVS